MILGITGGTGCGKTTLLECIREQGGLVLDCDAVYHEAYPPQNTQAQIYDRLAVYDVCTYCSRHVAVAV